MYLNRKSFAFNSDRPGAGGEVNKEAFVSAMKTVDVTFQNLDSSEISLTDVRFSICAEWCWGVGLCGTTGVGRLDWSESRA